MSLPRVAFGVLVQRGTVVAEDFSVAPALVVDTAVTVVLMVVVDACPVVFVGNEESLGPKDSGFV
jgi:hypothetical protein